MPSADTSTVTSPTRLSPPGRPGGDTPLAGVLRMLSVGGAAAAADVLQHVLETRTELTELVLRSSAGGGALARAGAVVSAYDEWVLDVPLRSSGATVGLLTARTAVPVTPELAGVLGAVADALSLVLVGSSAAAAQAVLDVEADLAAIAADLDDSVTESLVALRHTEPGNVATAAGEALRALRQIRRDLRATSLHDGLRAALAQLARPGVTVDATEPACDAVSPACAVVVERVAEMAVRGAVGTARISVVSDMSTVKLRVESADNSVDASELARWRRRAAALHGELRHWPGCVELTLPAHPDAPAPGSES